MARRKKHEEHENHERWLVSYADFITLLFAFFVVMYAVSSVNEGKYRTLSASLVAAFHNPSRALQPIQVGVLARTRAQKAMQVDKTPRNIQLPRHMQLLSGLLPLDTNKPDEGNPYPGRASKTKAPNRKDQDQLSKMADTIVKQMAPLIKNDLIKVTRTKLWLEVQINTSILFASGSDQLSEEAQVVLTELATILRAFPNSIRVEGFTDDVPISNGVFASNWELSAARAAQVVHLFAQQGVAPRRMAAVGFGEYHPVASNATADGRRKNRRVALVILAGHKATSLSDLERAADTGNGATDGAAKTVSTDSPRPPSPAVAAPVVTAPASDTASRGGST